MSQKNAYKTHNQTRHQRVALERFCDAGVFVKYNVERHGETIVAAAFTKPQWIPNANSGLKYGEDVHPEQSSGEHPRFIIEKAIDLLDLVELPSIVKMVYSERVCGELRGKHFGNLGVSTPRL